MDSFLIYTVIFLTSTMLTVNMNKRYRDKVTLVKQQHTILSNIMNGIGDKNMEIKKSKSIRSIIEAKGTEESYEAFARLVLEKIKDRFDKSFYKYFKEEEGQPASVDNYNTFHFNIAPEDMEHYLKMNKLFVESNLDGVIIEKKVMELLPEYLNLEGMSLLYFPENNGNRRYSAVSSIAHDSTVVAYFSFVREEDYAKVVKELEELIQKEKEETE